MTVLMGLFSAVILLLIMAGGSLILSLTQRGTPGAKGEKGDPGRGIASILLTNTVDNVDTYTVTYTDGAATTFSVTNGVAGDKGEQNIQDIIRQALGSDTGVSVSQGALTKEFSLVYG